VDKVIAAYADWFDIHLWRAEDGWACLAGTKRP